MTESLQLNAQLATFLAPLLWNLVAYRPHHDRRMVSVIQNKIGDILHSPLAEMTSVAILALRINPHIKRLSHHHHAQRIAEFHLPSRWHIVRRTNGITSHCLHHLNLTNQRRLVDCSAQRAQVVMQTNALQFQRLTIQLETMLTIYANGTDTYLHRLAVHLSHVLHIAQRNTQRIKIGRFWRP